MRRCLDGIHADSHAIVAAIPEVPVDARIELLRWGKERNAFCALSVPQAEAEEFLARDAFSCCDLLAVNQKEAEALSGSEGAGSQVARQLYNQLKRKNEDVMLLVSCGGEGAFSLYRDVFEHIPALPVDAVNTTGAGDALFGGTLSGLARGMPFQKGRSDRYFAESSLGCAVELGTLCAGLAVECEDTIAEYVDWEALADRLSKEGWRHEAWFIK
jgi:sugar/nucleoside kinase (ribokinase family)